MKIGNRLLRQLCAVFSLVLCASITGAALAQSYPNKPIRIILTVPPGAGLDIAARMVGDKLASASGQPVIIDNRGGASGQIATEAVIKAPPDGYTLLMTTVSHAINPSINRKLSYDPVKDFAPITQVTAQGFLIVAHPSVPARTLKDFIALAKSKKGGLVYGTAGIGVAGHLGMELLKTQARFDAVHVPYKGGGPAIIDLIAGQVDAAMVSMPALLPHVKSGKATGLAVTSLKRSALLPDLATVAESGFPGYEVSSWYGLLAPAGTPREVVAKLHGIVSRSLKLPDVRDLVAAGGSYAVGSTPQEFSAYIQAEMIKWGKVARQSGARMD